MQFEPYMNNVDAIVYVVSEVVRPSELFLPCSQSPLGLLVLMQLEAKLKDDVRSLMFVLWTCEGRWWKIT